MPVKKFPGGVILELAPILTGFVPEDSGEAPSVDFVPTCTSVYIQPDSRTIICNHSIVPLVIIICVDRGNILIGCSASFKSGSYLFSAGHPYSIIQVLS